MREGLQTAGRERDLHKDAAVKLNSEARQSIPHLHAILTFLQLETVKRDLEGAQRGLSQQLAALGKTDGNLRAKEREVEELRAEVGYLLRVVCERSIFCDIRRGNGRKANVRADDEEKQ